ncbi:alpha/beta hydrolase fold domain-containing protein [Pyruvatibacter sp.]|uniref:alpha/beta hydrolase fold domain-containing protein n=1 Tax=Pyruvatibacter sp. TaxID=1981328 RepID=UPI003267AC44
MQQASGLDNLGAEVTPATGLPVTGVWIAQPDTRADARIVLYVYGGTFSLNRGPMQEIVAGRIATHARARVLLFDYSLAPEQPFPLAIEDVTATYLALLEQGHDPSKIVVMGDTSGAGIALAALISLRDQQHPMPAGFVALTPLVDLTFSGGTYVSNIRSNGSTSDVELIMTLAFDYLQGADPRHPLASPVLADLAGMPEIEIHADVKDVLYDDAIMLAEKLRGTGGKVSLYEWDGLADTWQRLAPLSTQSTAALARIGQFVRKQTGSQAPAGKADADNLITSYQGLIKEFVQPHTRERVDEIFEWSRAHGPEWVWPFIQRRLKHGALVTQDQVERDWLTMLFTEASDGMLLLSASRHILLSNKRARDRLETETPILLKNGRLFGTTEADDDALQTALDALFQASPSHIQRAVRLEGVKGKRGHTGPTLLRGERLQQESEGRGVPPVVLLRLLTPPDTADIDEAALVTWYGLSKKEAKLAAAFATGASLAGFAKENDVSITTVRTQFANLKAKLGASDQAAVVRHVLQAATHTSFP